MPDPTSLTWTAGGTFRPTELMDPNRVLMDHTDFSGITLTVWTYDGTTAPTVVGDATGITITTASGTTKWGISFPVSCYPPAPMAVCELTYASSSAAGGLLGWGPGLFKDDGSYATIDVRTDNTSIISNRVMGSSVNFNGGNTFAYSNISTSGRRLIGTFCNSVASLFYDSGSGETFAYPAASGNTMTTAFTGASATEIDKVAGYPDQRDITQVGHLTMGIVGFATAAGATLHISRVRTGYYYAGSILANIAVLRTSTGGPIVNTAGKILISNMNQGPSIDGWHNINSWAGICWYDPATDTVEPPVSRLVSRRPAPWGTTVLCTDSDSCVLYEDRAGDPNYGKWHVYLGTTGTSYSSRGADATYNHYDVVYQLVSGGYPDGELDSLSVVTFPSGVKSPYEQKVVCDATSGRWYCVGICSATDYTSPPTYLFIASGTTPSAFPSTVLEPTAGTSQWDGVGIFRYYGVWYAIAAQVDGTYCYRLFDGAYMGAMNLGGPYSGYIPHSNIVPVQSIVAGVHQTEYRMLSHNGNYTAFGQDFSFGGTINSTWFFGDLVTRRADQIRSAYEFPPFSTNRRTGAIRLQTGGGLKNQSGGLLFTQRLKSTAPGGLKNQTGGRVKLQTSGFLKLQRNGMTPFGKIVFDNAILTVYDTDKTNILKIYTMVESAGGHLNPIYRELGAMGQEAFSGGITG